MMATRKTRRMKDGKAEKLCGGYVSWDGRGKNSWGGSNRTTKEIEVWVPASLTTDDCGKGTNALVAALKAKVAGKRNVEVLECWDC